MIGVELVLTTPKTFVEDVVRLSEAQRTENRNTSNEEYIKSGDADGGERSHHTESDILSDKTLTNQTGKVDNYVSNTKGATAAKADFDAMNPTNIRTYSNGTIVGDLPDGKKINLHLSTTLKGTPSVEIYDPITGKSIKIRY